MLALVTVCSAQAVEMATGSGGNGGARRQGRHSERPAVEMVPEYTGTAAQGFGCGVRTARSGSVRARSCRVNWLVRVGALAKARQWQWCR